MTKSRISKTLEAIIAHTSLTLTSDKTTTSYSDRLIIELLGNEATFAYRLVEMMAGEHSIGVVMRRIMSCIVASPHIETTTPEEHYRALCTTLQNIIEARHISSAHILYIVSTDITTATAQALRSYGIVSEDILATINRLAEGETKQDVETPVSDSKDDREASPLDKFGENLTQRARRGEIDPVIGRDKEIERVVHILSRRKKCNPILIGEAGVGKSAIVEALALRIARQEVPSELAGKELYSLDMAMLIAGTKFRGEFEQRIKELLTYIDKHGDVILFIDEVHTIVGAGATTGTLDVANILKPALARGTIQAIGATTPEEYHQSIERDAALDRRFQPVRIELLGMEATREIVRCLAPYYTKHHGVEYSDGALDLCVTLADKFITSRHFPDKAIDIMDEAGVMARMDYGMRGASGCVEAHHVEHVVSMMVGESFMGAECSERQSVS